MLSIFKYLSDLPTLLALWADVQALFKDYSEANVDKLVQDAKPVVAKYAPTIPPAELDAVATEIVAIAAMIHAPSAQSVGVMLAAAIPVLQSAGIKVNLDEVPATIQQIVKLLNSEGIQ